MAVKPNFIDTHYHVEDVYEVGREKVREYAIAVKNDHPAHSDIDAARELGVDGLIAPPTFVAIFGVIAQSRLLELGGLDVSRVMQSDQRIIFHKPLVTGVRLDCEVSVDSVREMAGSDIIVTKNVITDKSGDPVLTTFTTIVHRADAASEPAAAVDAEEAQK